MLVDDRHISSHICDEFLTEVPAICSLCTVGGVFNVKGAAQNSRQYNEGAAPKAMISESFFFISVLASQSIGVGIDMRCVANLDA